MTYRGFSWSLSEKQLRVQVRQALGRNHNIWLSEIVESEAQKKFSSTWSTVHWLPIANSCLYHEIWCMMNHAFSWVQSWGLSVYFQNHYFSIQWAPNVYTKGHHLIREWWGRGIKIENHMGIEFFLMKNNCIHGRRFLIIWVNTRKMVGNRKFYMFPFGQWSHQWKDCSWPPQSSAWWTTFIRQCYYWRSTEVKASSRMLFLKKHLLWLQTVENFEAIPICVGTDNDNQEKSRSGGLHFGAAVPADCSLS